MEPVFRRARGDSPDHVMIGRSVDRLTGWLRSLLRHTAVEREMHDEMSAHLAQATERLMARGLTPAQARIEARREFGNVAVVQEEARDARGVRLISEFSSDVRHSVRALMHAPAFSLSA